jgi:hypothetical protein
MAGHPRLPVVLTLACLPVAAIAAPLILAHPAKLSIPAPDLSLFENLPPAERLASCERQLEQTISEREAAKQTLGSIRSELAKCETEQIELPVKIAESTFTTESLDEEWRAMVQQRDSALSALEATEIREQQNLKMEKDRLSSAFDEALSAEFDKIDDARRKRDEERKRIGALPSTQDEAVHVRQQKKRAKASAELQLAANLDAAEQRCDQIIAAAHNKAKSLDESATQAKQALQESRHDLVVAQARLDQLPQRISDLHGQAGALELRLSKLAQQEEIHRQAAALARIELEEQQKRESDLARAVAAAPTVSPAVRTGFSPNVETRTEPESGWSKLATRMDFPQDSLDSSRYLDFAYRPSVGHHSVRGHFRRNGTYVEPHMRTNRDDSFYNNWSAKGNINPFTGKHGMRQPSLRNAY